ncbi:MAG: NUDIX hydrolase [Sphingobacteriaceae bacterium]
MYIIYLNEVRLLITEQASKVPLQYQVLEEKDFSIADFFQQKCSVNAPESYVLLVANAAQFFTAVTKQFQLIEAAGGFVYNEEGACLFIYRRNKWDLPKGKIDDGERPIETAKREVEEECGVVVAHVNELLAKTYHLYSINGEVVLKKTYWYAMEVSGKPHLIPQAEEDITRACWLFKNQLDEVKANTYPLILDLINEQLK